MPIRVDMGSAESSPTFEPFPIGDHPFVIEGVKLSDNPGPSGFHYIEFAFKYDEAAGELEGYANRKQWRRYSLSPKALWALKEDLVKLGVEVPDDEFDFDEQEVIGQTVTLTLSQKPNWQGKKDDDGNVLMDNEVDKVDSRESFGY